MLKRAIRTQWLMLEQLEHAVAAGERSWRLNERHYGALQGLNKVQTAQRHGEAQVKIWRRSYDIHPRRWSRTIHAIHASIRAMPGRSGGAALDGIAQDTLERVIPLGGSCRPTLMQGRDVLIVAHGNSLRALVKQLDGCRSQAIVDLNIPTGVPLLYELERALTPARAAISAIRRPSAQPPRPSDARGRSGLSAATRPVSSP